MKIILRKEHENLGAIGDQVEVKSGYARNYLIPNQIAYPSTDSAVRAIVEERKQGERRSKKQQGIAEKRAVDLEKLSITIPMQVGEEEKLFGAVTSSMIAEALKAHGVEVDRRSIMLDEPIKALGIYEVPVKLHSHVIAKIKVWVVSQ
jgi:large subunit ribosomal protein L9